MSTSLVIRKKLKPEIKALWLAALRSGEYKQGTGRLKTQPFISIDGSRVEEQYCCLGVLCDIAVKEGVVKKFDGQRGGTPRPVAEWAGLTRWDPGVLGTKNMVQGYLAVLNDGDYLSGESPRSFDEIADWIEENL